MSITAGLPKVAVAHRPDWRHDTGRLTRRDMAWRAGWPGLAGIGARLGDQRLELLGLLGAQLHHVLLDRNLLLGHKSSPSPPRSNRDSQNRHTFNGAGG